MADLITQLTDDVSFIQMLGDNPNSDNGMNSTALKEWFDKAPNVIKKYINEVLVPELNAKFGNLDTWTTEADEKIEQFKAGTGFLPLDGGLPMHGAIDMAGFTLKNIPSPTASGDAVPKSYVMTMAVTSVTLPSSGWSGGKQTVNVTGVVADTSKQAIITTAAAASLETYLDCDISCTSQSAGKLTFSCGDTPTANITVNVLILTKGG